MTRYATLHRGRRRLGATFRKDAESEARAIQEATARLEPGWVILLGDLFRRLGTGVNASFAIQVAQGNEDGAMNALALAEFREALADGAQELSLSAFDAAGQVAVDVSGFDLGFDTRSDDVLRMSAQRSGTLVTNIDADTRRAIRLAVRDSIELGDNARVAAESIRPLVGLTERHSVAMGRLRKKLLDAGGLSRDKVNRVVAKRAQKLLTYHTEMIARTEMLWSANAAQHEYWMRAMSAGLIPPTVNRVWIVTDDDRLCDECAPLDGAVVEFHEPFISTELGRPGEELRPRPQNVISEYPPLHPMCRCVTGLEY